MLLPRRRNRIVSGLACAMYCLLATTNWNGSYYYSSHIGERRQSPSQAPSKNPPQIRMPPRLTSSTGPWRRRQQKTATAEYCLHRGQRMFSAPGQTQCTLPSNTAQRSQKKRHCARCNLANTAGICRLELQECANQPGAGRRVGAGAVPRVLGQDVHRLPSPRKHARAL